jgi:hypothetical protein
MKTLTEVAAPNLKNAAKVKQDLAAAGKTAEEMPQALGEALKLEGDKLNFLINAVDLVGDKQTDLKRVVVYALNEGETAPKGVQQKGEHYYMVEYYPSLNPPKAKGRGDQHEGRGGKRGGRGGRGDKDKKRGGGGRGGPRQPRGEKKE